ncbi:MAG TPA: hypothetical protein VF092_17540 [Longimicrobium sp.]
MPEYPEDELPPRPELGNIPPGAPGGAGGGGREWPAYEPQQPDPTRLGVRAAFMIFGVVVVIHLLLLAFVKLSGNSENAWLFLPEGLLVIAGALGAAIFVTLKLPPPARGPFWAAGVACMFLSFIIWGATCAVAL